MKILIVCLGNICRSPLAHGILQHLSEPFGWLVESAGTSNWHEGGTPDRRSVLAAQKLGYDISKQRARHFKPGYLDEYDLILTMDNNNLSDVLALAKTDEQRAKVKLFIPETNVTDPYYDDALFEPVAQQIEERCKDLIAEIR